MSLVEVARSGRIAVVTLASPPVNALGYDLRRTIATAVEDANADAAVDAVVLIGRGRGFSAGADIGEFGAPSQRPNLPDLCDRIEASAKPVIAAIHGFALGGGLELALAAHYRIALGDARLGLPEVDLGLLPGAGGTQRLPRLIGADAALQIMTSGRPLTGRMARHSGIIDALAKGDLLAASMKFVEDADLVTRGPRPTRDRVDGFSDPASYTRDIVRWRKATTGQHPEALGRIVDCVEAARLFPFEAGQAFERQAFEDCRNSLSSKALRYLFKAEREAGKPAEGMHSPAVEIKRVGIIGGGLMGSGIAQACLDAGLAVNLSEQDSYAAERAERRIAESYDRAVARGKISAAERAGRMARLSCDLGFGGLSAFDLIIEAVYEDFGAKAAVLRDISAVMRPGALLATNTSYVSLDALGAHVTAPERFIGLHFFSPAQVMRLLEVIPSRATAPGVLAASLAFAKRIGKVAVLAGPQEGFVANTVLTAYRAAADIMLEDGARPAEIDAAMRAYGFALGPYQVLDLAGLEISWARRRQLASHRDPHARYVSVADRLCDAGWFGRKTGRGYYRYDSDGRGHEDPDVLAIISECRAAKGIVPRSFEASEIQNRCLAAMTNAGARLVGDGVANRPSDVDVAMVNGFGFPRHKGGPMFVADAEGLDRLHDRLSGWSTDAPEVWALAPLIDKLRGEKSNFGDLNNAL